MPAPGRALTGLAAALYVLSGVTQPLLMTLVRLRRARPGCRPSCLLDKLLTLSQHAAWPSLPTAVACG